jgi:hypothetical protein
MSSLEQTPAYKLAYEFAELNYIIRKFNSDKKLAGKGRVLQEVKNLSLRNPRQCSLARTAGRSRDSKFETLLRTEKNAHPTGSSSLMSPEFLLFQTRTHRLLV